MFQSNALYVHVLQGTLYVPYTEYEELEDENHMSNKYHEVVAINCQMVGGGSDGSLDVLGRVCLVDEEENIIFHTYVEPELSVTDYRYFTFASCLSFLIEFDVYM